MDVGYWASWIVWFRLGFKYPRRCYETIIKYVMSNPIELRVAYLKSEIQKLLTIS